MYAIPTMTKIIRCPAREGDHACRAVCLNELMRGCLQRLAGVLRSLLLFQRLLFASLENLVEQLICERRLTHIKSRHDCYEN